MESGNYTSKSVYWATSNELEVVIELAKILSLCQILFQTNSEFNIHEFDLKSTPLWASSCLGKVPPTHYSLCYVEGSSWLSLLLWADTIIMPEQLLITDQDRAELETFDAFNNWGMRNLIRANSGHLRLTSFAEASLFMLPVQVWFHFLHLEHSINISVS